MCSRVFVFLEEKKNKRRRAGAAIFFSGADFAATVLLLSRNFIQPIFPASREIDLCGGSKREFFEDSFRMRSSSICLDLRLDLPIYFIHYIWMISLFWDHLV